MFWYCAGILAWFWGCGRAPVLTGIEFSTKEFICFRRNSVLSLFARFMPPSTPNLRNLILGIVTSLLFLTPLFHLLCCFSCQYVNTSKPPHLEYLSLPGSHAFLTILPSLPSFHRHLLERKVCLGHTHFISSASLTLASSHNTPQVHSV